MQSSLHFSLSAERRLGAARETIIPRAITSAPRKNEECVPITDTSYFRSSPAADLATDALTSVPQTAAGAEEGDIADGPLEDRLPSKVFTLSSTRTAHHSTVQEYSRTDCWQNEIRANFAIPSNRGCPSSKTINSCGCENQFPLSSVLLFDHLLVVHESVQMRLRPCLELVEHPQEFGL